jgi:hypothetical protein
MFITIATVSQGQESSDNIEFSDNDDDDNIPHSMRNNVL